MDWYRWTILRPANDRPQRGRATAVLRLPQRELTEHQICVPDTELLYATDAYLRTFDALVQEVTPDGGVILDRTALYPTGGGQPHDLGSLSWDGGTAKVVEVRKDGSRVVHRIEGALPPVGSSVQGELDWDRRYALMRHHTALHSMSGVIFQLYGATVTGGQMYPDRARMDFLLPDLSQDRLHKIEERTNALLAEGHPVSIQFYPRAEAFQIPDLIRTRVNLIPEGVQEIRVVNIEGIDQQADGGTHVPTHVRLARCTLRARRTRARATNAWRSCCDDQSRPGRHRRAGRGTSSIARMRPANRRCAGRVN